MAQDYFAFCQDLVRTQESVSKELVKAEIKRRWFAMSAQEIREELEAKGFHVTDQDIKDCGPETPQQIEQWLSQ